MLVSLDFDGVISTKAPGKRLGTLMEGAKEALDDLEESGYTLVIHTLRAKTEKGKEAVENFLDYYELPYNDVTNLKPDAIIFIDNKAIRFESWPQTIRDFKRITGED